MSTPGKRRAVVLGCALVLLAVLVELAVAASRLHAFEPRARHAAPVPFLSLSRDGSRLFSVCPGEQKFLLRDLENPYERWRGARSARQGDGSWGYMAPDGRSALVVRAGAAGTEDQRVLDLFDLERWVRVRVLDRARCRSIAFASDAPICAWASSSGVHVAALPGGDVIVARPPTWHDTTDLAFTSDGKRLAVGEDDHVLLEDTMTGRPIQSFAVAPRPAAVHGVCFSPDGRTLVAASDLGIVAFDVATGVERWRGAGDGDDVEFAPDGTVVFVRDDPAGTHAFEVTTGRPVRGAAGSLLPFQKVTFAAGTDTVAVGFDDGSIQIEPAETFLTRLR